MEETFAAPWSRLLKWLSFGVSIVLVGVSLLVARDLTPRASWLWLVAVAGPLVLVAASALFTIRGYRLDGPCLRVRRLLWDTRIPLEGLRSAEADPLAMKRSLRLFGNGGLYSFSGLFRSKALGRFRAWVTDPARAVVLRFGDRTLVVSPGDPVAFARRVRELRRLDRS